MQNLGKYFNNNNNNVILYIHVGILFLPFLPAIQVYILNDDGTEFYKSDPEEKELDEGDKHPDTVPPFNAYAPNGTVQVSLRVN